MKDTEEPLAYLSRAELQLNIMKNIEREAIGLYLSLNGTGTPHTTEELERVRNLL